MVWNAGGLVLEWDDEVTRKRTLGLSVVEE